MTVSWKGVRGGTPMHDKSLCDNCTHAHRVKGSAASEQITICRAVYESPAPAPFRIVIECSSHMERNAPNLYEMQKIAYIMATDPKGKPMGFRPNAAFRADTKVGDKDLTDGFVRN